VLILAPSNYPLFVPGVQVLQALATGNVVRVKPAPGCSAPLLRMADLLAQSGLPRGILEVLGDTVEAAERAIGARPDKVILTGTVETGRSVLSSLAQFVIPATMELSGCDAAFVCEDADLDLAANALLYGLRLNRSATCIAPRRVFCVRRHLPAFAERIEMGLSQLPAVNLPAARRAKVEALLDDAERQGAQVIIGQTVDRDRFSPVLVHNAVPSMALLQADVFAPVLSLVEVRDLDEALDGNRQCPYALGASIFAAPDTAAKLADLIEVGVVTINDVIVPTADPRLPFGGRRASGFGVTRGREGLLDMTVPKVTIERRGRFRPHYAPPRDDDVDLYLAYIEAVHGAGMRRMTAFGRLVVRLARRMGIKRQ
ncbi:MAG TPA: aldehyde dehydrogenase family protein, partial [Nitrospira sp.]|nr:aldehyde dehydrogenase family protein [Nitrospira sp.]